MATTATSAVVIHKATARCMMCGWSRQMTDVDGASLTDANNECIAHVNATLHYIVATTSTDYVFYIPGGPGDPALLPKTPTS
jgi:hypothetical protein